MVYLASPTPVVVNPTTTLTGPAWTAAQHVWVAPDGTEWDLTGGLSGLLLLAGARGMLNPPTIRYSRRSPSRSGSLYSGSITDERPVLWPLRVFQGDGSSAWIAHNDRFWNSLDASRDYPGTWKITQPGDENTQTVMRWLKVRFDSLVDDTLNDDLGLVPHLTYGINMVADTDPFWRGEKITRRFVAPPVAQNFFGGANGNGFGPPYVISSGQTTATASIPNPGDVGCYPVLKVMGPTTFVRIGVNGHFVEFPMVLNDGDTREINTDPSDQVCYDQNGNDRTIQLGAVDFFEIQASEVNIPLSIAITGTGSAEVSITPGFNRAKGVSR